MQAIYGRGICEGIEKDQRVLGDSCLFEVFVKELWEKQLKEEIQEKIREINKSYPIDRGFLHPRYIREEEKFYANGPRTAALTAAIESIDPTSPARKPPAPN
jgi:hypothetical protein